MDISMETKFILRTTVDITNHIKVSKENRIAYGQKQNFMTVINTIGLRVNPTIDDDPILVQDNKNFNDNKVWQLTFTIAFEGALTIDMMLNDFMLVPFIAELEETEDFKENVFLTKGKDKNIVFETFDK